MGHRPQISNHQPISNSYTHSTGHYSSVKVEDDHYMVSAHDSFFVIVLNASQPAHQNTLHYSYTNGHNNAHNGLDWQGGYSSERGHLQR
jgi:hypothetical protein